jgi:hypothetical protein
VALDPETLQHVDAFTWHIIREVSSETFGNSTRRWSYGKVDFTNEMEYQPGAYVLRAYVRARRSSWRPGLRVWPISTLVRKNALTSY